MSMHTVKTYLAGAVAGSMVGLVLGAAVLTSMEPKVGRTLKRKSNCMMRQAQRKMHALGIMN